jgi:quinol monooxygenase YgiN
VGKLWRTNFPELSISFSTRSAGRTLAGPLQIHGIIGLSDNRIKVDALHKAMYSILEPTRKESGCLSYKLHQSLDQPNIFVMLEKFKSKDALEFHLKQPYFINFKNTSPKFAESLTVDTYKVASAPKD